MMMKYGLNTGGGNTVQCPDPVSWRCTLETYVISLANATPINLMKVIFIKKVIFNKKENRAESSQREGKDVFLSTCLSVRFLNYKQVMKSNHGS